MLVPANFGAYLEGLNNYCQVLGQLKPAEALLVASYNRSDVLGTKYWVFMHFMDFIAHKLR